VRAAQLLTDLAALDVRLHLVGDRLKVNAPEGVVTEAMRAELAARKGEIVALLRDRRGAPVFLDFETRSLAQLKEVGGRRYARHPSTEALCLVARMPDGSVLEWRRGDPPPARLFAAVAAGHPLVAHNGMKFDRHIWNRLGWPPATWIDTAELAMLAGLPRALDDIAKQLLGREKDKAGRHVTLRLSRPGKDGRLPVVAAEDLDRVVLYCRDDVELLAQIWLVRLGAIREVEGDIRKLDTRINDTGFGFDRALAEAVIECDAFATNEQFKTSGIDPATVRSPMKLMAALAQHGVNVADIQKDRLEPLLGDPHLPQPARELIDARIASVGIATAKLKAALARLDEDGRLRDTFTYHGAHTGRWTAQGFQPQNLPQGTRKEVDVDALVALVTARDHAGLRDLAQRLGVKVRDLTAKLVRSCVCAPAGELLAVVDYSSVEPRVLAWVTDNQLTLEVFRNGGDLYKPMAAKVFNVPVDAVTKPQRNQAKPIVLGCCYGLGGEPGFRVYGEENGIDWSKMPLTPTQVVDLWRDTNPLVAGVRVDGRGPRRGGLWQKLEDAAIRSCLGESVTVGPTVWTRDRDDVVCELPSGRRMVYRSALVEMLPTPWNTMQEAMTYLRYKDGKVSRASVYGGLLTENVVQAISREVLVDALLRLDRAGFAIVLHVRDEIVAEIDNIARFEEMKGLMRVSPPWCADLPLQVEGYAERRYRK